MDKLNAYLDGLLDSGAETFPREALERIKALANERPTMTIASSWQQGPTNGTAAPVSRNWFWVNGSDHNMVDTNS